MNINELNLKKKIVKVSFMEHNSACQGWIPLFNPQYPRVKVISLCLIHSIRAYVLLSFYLKYVRII